MKKKSKQRFGQLPTDKICNIAPGSVVRLDDDSLMQVRWHHPRVTFAAPWTEELTQEPPVTVARDTLVRMEIPYEPTRSIWNQQPGAETDPLSKRVDTWVTTSDSPY